MARENFIQHSNTGAADLTLELYDAFEPLEGDWRALEVAGLCSFYQSFDWCSTWYHALGRPKGAQAVLLCAKNSVGKCVFILPLARLTINAARIVTWIGVPELTYGSGIYDRDWLASDGARLQNLWRKIVKKIQPADALWLCDQPEDLDGNNNPLSFAFSQQNANRGYRVALGNSFEELFTRKRSSSSRRGIRKRDKKLKACGEVTFGLPESQDEAGKVIDTMLEHQRQRLAAKGVTDFYSDQRKRFLHSLLQLRDAAGHLILMPYHLKIDGTITAVMLGGRFHNTYWALIASLIPESKYHALSPGDYALRCTIKDLCDNGFDTLDFAAGDTDYKLHWRDETVQLYDTIVPITFKGYVWATIRSGRIFLKNTIKKNQVLFDLALRLRKLLFAR